MTKFCLINHKSIRRHFVNFPACDASTVTNKHHTDADLDKIVTFGHENEKQATKRWGLWHMADHSR